MSTDEHKSAHFSAPSAPQPLYSTPLPYDLSLSSSDPLDVLSSLAPPPLTSFHSQQPPIQPSSSLPNTSFHSSLEFPTTELYRSANLATLGQEDVWRSVAVDNGSATQYEQQGTGNAFYDLSAAHASGNKINDIGDLPLSTAAKPSDYTLLQPRRASNDNCHQPPCVPGNYLEPSSHFFSTMQPNALLQHLLTHLQQQKVDCTAFVEKFKIHCKAYRCGASLPFVVRIFRAGECDGADSGAKRYAIEFQRRAGDVIFFFDLFRNARASLHTSEPASSSSHATMSGPLDMTSLNRMLPSELSIPKLTHSWSAPPLDSDVHGWNPCKTSLCSTVKSLVAMCSSDCIDVRRNALTALADLSSSADDTMLDVFVEDGVVDCFMKALSCTHEDVHRAALTGLANIAKEKKAVCRKLMQCQRSMDRLYNLANSQTTHVVRECARAFRHVGTNLGPTSVCEGMRRKLQTLACSPDPTTRRYVHQLMEALTSE